MFILRFTKVSGNEQKISQGCASADESSPFDSGSDDDWGDDDWKRKKRSVDDEDYYEEFEAFENPDEDENSEW